MAGLSEQALEIKGRIDSNASLHANVSGWWESFFRLTHNSRAKVEEKRKGVVGVARIELATPPV